VTRQLSIMPSDRAEAPEDALPVGEYPPAKFPDLGA
jgi:hypothetical protein